MTTDIDWNLYRSLLAVLREGSLSRAARALGSTQPTVGRHICALEQALKAPLFVRSQTGLLPTELARALESYAQGMSSTAAALQRAAASQGTGVRGVVRITASDVIGVEVLPPIIAALRLKHTALQTELVLSNRVHDLLQREADVAVRMTAPQQGSLIARRIGSIDLGLHATREYLERSGTPDNVSALRTHTLIGFDQMTPYIRDASRKLPHFDRETFALRTDSDLAHMALIRAGAGIGWCQVPIGRRDGLVRLLPRQFSLPLETWIVMHQDLRGSPRCRAVFDALVTGLQQHLSRK